MRPMMRVPFTRTKCAIESRHPYITIPRVFDGEEVPYFNELVKMVEKFGYVRRLSEEDGAKPEDIDCYWVNPKLEKQNEKMQKYFSKMRKQLIENA